MCFFYLLLGHLLGDFVLQTNKIAENKAKCWQWNAVHAAVVTGCMLLFSVPFGLWVVGFVLLNGVFHYFIDLYKQKISKKYPLPGLVYFLTDQFIHVLLIYAISKTAVVNMQLLFVNQNILKILLTVCFVTSFSAVLNQYLLILIFPNINKNFFEEGEKSIGNMTRLLLTSSLFLSVRISGLFLVFIAAAGVFLMLQYKKKWRTWMRVKHLCVKLLLDLVMSLSGLLFLLID